VGGLIEKFQSPHCSPHITIIRHNLPRNNVDAPPVDKIFVLRLLRFTRHVAPAATCAVSRACQFRDTKRQADAPSETNLSRNNTKKYFNAKKNYSL